LISDRRRALISDRRRALSSACRRALRFVASAALVAASAASAAGLAPLSGSASEPPAPWRVVGLPKQAAPLTRFSLAEIDGKRVLRVEADSAYGNLVHPLENTRAGMLSWRWRVDQPPSGADLKRKSGDDVALKVCAFFDMPMAQVPFVERQLLRIASSRTGEKLPTATLCYAWDAALPQGTLLHNAYTQRVRYIVTHGTPKSWREETHDLAADFRRAFGDESPDVPALAAIVIGADSDNTGSRSIGYVADLHLSTAP
jgi:Protein of unknown function (DUF3047)